MALVIRLLFTAALLYAAWLDGAGVWVLVTFALLTLRAEGGAALHWQHKRRLDDLERRQVAWQQLVADLQRAVRGTQDRIGVLEQPHAQVKPTDWGIRLQ